MTNLLSIAFSNLESHEIILLKEMNVLFPQSHATDILHNCHPKLYLCIKVAAFVNHMMMCIKPQRITYVVEYSLKLHAHLTSDLKKGDNPQ